MSIDNPVGDHSRDPYERYRILREQQERSQGDGDKPPDKKPHLLARLLAMILQTLETLVNKTRGHESAKAGASFQENLLLLKTALNALKEEDRSQDVPFLNEMSEVWHYVLEDSLKFQRSDPVFVPLQNFIDDMQTYPPGETHTFAYYLTEYTGQQWLPFPYMDLIRQLYHEHQTDPSASPLTRWARQIDELLAISS